MIEELPDERLLPPETVAKVLCMSRDRLLRMAHGRDKTGVRIPCVRISKYQTLFKAGDVRRFIEERYRK